jgi:hypothetical protein
MSSYSTDPEMQNVAEKFEQNKWLEPDPCTSTFLNTTNKFFILKRDELIKCVKRIKDTRGKYWDKWLKTLTNIAQKINPNEGMHTIGYYGINMSNRSYFSFLIRMEGSFRSDERGNIDIFIQLSKTQEEKALEKHSNAEPPTQNSTSSSGDPSTFKEPLEPK